MSARDDAATAYMLEVYGAKTRAQFLYWNDGLEIFNAGWEAAHEAPIHHLHMIQTLKNSQQALIAELEDYRQQFYHVCRVSDLKQAEIEDLQKEIKKLRESL